MTRWLKIVAILLGSIAVLLLLAIHFTVGWRPFIGARSRPLTERRFEPTPERVVRGAYLVEHVLVCFDCHSERDPSLPGWPAVASKKGAGRVWKDEGMPWLVASNITSDSETGVGAASDDALARAIREGIGLDGRALFPLMPYSNYRRMTDEDLASVIVYLRATPPVRNQLGKTVIPMPVRLLIRNVPEPVTTAVTADLKTPLERGAYLAKLASCEECHTPSDHGDKVPGMNFAGGFPFAGPNGVVASSNLTPDPSGIPYYDEKLFKSVMRTGQVGARKLSDIMPWAFYAGMTDEDLSAILLQLRSVPAVKHRVDNSLPPSQCRLCRQEHGAGSEN